MEGFLDILMGGGIGSAVGAIAGIGQEYMRSKFTAQEKAAEREHIETMHQMQFNQDSRMAENDLLIANVEAEKEMLVGSYEHDSSIKDTSPWVNNVRALVRPSATAGTFIGSFVNPAVFFPAFMLCLTWWFSGRGTKSYLEK